MFECMCETLYCGEWLKCLGRNFGVYPLPPAPLQPSFNNDTSTPHQEPTVRVCMKQRIAEEGALSSHWSELSRDGSKLTIR
ncbi:hypothetical protein Trydic_g21584 [Trypoxylus dichotomus]